MKLRFSLLLLTLALALAACGEATDTHPGQPVAHRRDAFKALMRGFEPMGVMLRKDGYQADQFKTLADQFGPLAEAPWPYFLPDTLYPPSNALPTVWSEPDQFAKREQAFRDTARRLVQAAQTGQREQVVQAYDAVHEQCRVCHESFKGK